MDVRDRMIRQRKKKKKRKWKKKLRKEKGKQGRDEMDAWFLPFSKGILVYIIIIIHHFNIYQIAATRWTVKSDLKNLKILKIIVFGFFF